MNRQSKLIKQLIKQSNTIIPQNQMTMNKSMSVRGSMSQQNHYGWSRLTTVSSIGMRPGRSYQFNQKTPTMYNQHTNRMYSTVKLNYKLTENENGVEDTPLVMIHGLFGNRLNFLTYTANSKQSGGHKKIYSLDLRNHGKSPIGEDMSITTMAQDVLQFLNDEGIEKCHLFGFSLGGRVAMLLALNHGDRIEKLALGDISPLTYASWNIPSVLKAMQSVDLEECKSRKEIDKLLTEAGITDQQERIFLTTNIGRTKEDGFYWKIPLEIYEKNLEALAYFPVEKGLTVPKDHYAKELTNLAPYSEPTLLIRGELSNYVKDEYIPLIKSMFTECELKTYPGAAHWVHFENPGQFFHDIQSHFIPSYEPLDPAIIH